MAQTEEIKRIISSLGGKKDKTPGETEELENKKSELKQWAEKALAYYNETAPRLNLAFYQFQKPADFDNDCALLILGINPGGGGTYDSQFHNPNKDCGWNSPTPEGTPRINEKGLTMAGFLAGNPCFGAKWPIIKGLSRIGLGFDRLDRMGNWQFVNYIPFSTKDFDTFRNIAKCTDVLSRCISYTEEYIRILSPKRIIVLGTSGCFDFLKGKTDCKVLLRGQYRYIITARICDMPSLAVYHPSRLRSRSEKVRDKMKSMMDLYLAGKESEIESVELKETPKPKGRKDAKEIMQGVVSKLMMSGMEQSFDKGNTKRFLFCKSLELTITATFNGYIALRFHTNKGQTLANDIRSQLKRFPKFKTENCDPWLGRKDFSAYDSDTDKAVAEIVEDIKKLESELSGY